jgi:hypothetical protein
VFSISNFSGNMTDAEPKPTITDAANKTQHPSTRQAVAWEIKFKQPENVETEKGYNYTDL